ncbi:signal peptide peptidase SppA [Phocicoccus pinnipedialis]|uniref:Signal peptide peptidase SppA n=1 Tax=Phocicoccus pinnipedialis TaxID=110845 RepID=A0A6V7RCT0_9BACL|nr:signal peptide peptidase SppA [Jeotgalicoccus pinnipedialis]MBP1939512.1 protease-4 [Jeotgalicoccus pinnipedialis]CAD2075078.1 Putative signal peptide peptidase SppA [Jeotgalicoccus pinnipedialis]
MKRTVALISAIALVLIGISMSVYNTFRAAEWEDFFTELTQTSAEIPETVVEKGDEMNRIAIINIEGVIQDIPISQGIFAIQGGYNHQMTIAAIKNIIEDDTTKAIILNINSPGGGVYESAEIHKYLVEAKAKGKKIYSSMGNMAASGGYYVSAPADKIFATNETITGSIGVIMQNINYHELAEKYGVKFETYKSGEMKDMLSPTKETPETEKEYIQSIVDSMYSDFVTVVSEGRGMSEKDVRKLADGRIYLGSEAMKNGLVDEEGYFDDALNALKKEVGKNPQVYAVGGDPSALGFFNLKAPDMIQSLFKQNDIETIQALMQRRQGIQPMYLYE